MSQHMVYVGHLFRWQPENAKLLYVARKYDYFWARMWSDKSFDEVARMYHALRGSKTWLWCRDNHSVPYYLLTPHLRERAMKFGAVLKDWDNPQLSPDNKPVYLKPKYLEKEKQTLAYQQETQGGIGPLLFTEEDLLRLASILRDTKSDADFDDDVFAPINPDPSRQAPGQAPQ
jgi:hypothetical protein